MKKEFFKYTCTVLAVYTVVLVFAMWVVYG